MTRFSCSALALILCGAIVGCDGSDTEGASPGPDQPTTGSSGQPGKCELESTMELADENEVAPNGQTGAQILAAVPASLHTSLHWDFSTADIEVEVAGTSGLSSEVDFTFSFPAEPQFVFEDWVYVPPSGESQTDLEVICGDVIATTIDATVVTQDGTVSLDLPGLNVHLGPDRPETNFVAQPLVYTTSAMATPDVSFVEPEALPADTEKTISIGFDGQSTEGVIIVRAQSSSATYSHAVARW